MLRRRGGGGTSSRILQILITLQPRRLYRISWSEIVDKHAKFSIIYVEKNVLFAMLQVFEVCTCNFLLQQKECFSCLTYYYIILLKSTFSWSIERICNIAARNWFLLRQADLFLVQKKCFERIFFVQQTPRFKSFNVSLLKNEETTSRFMEKSLGFATSAESAIFRTLFLRRILL